MGRDEGGSETGFSVFSVERSVALLQPLLLGLWHKVAEQVMHGKRSRERTRGKLTSQRCDRAGSCEHLVTHASSGFVSASTGTSSRLEPCTKVTVTVTAGAATGAEGKAKVRSSEVKAPVHGS